MKFIADTHCLKWYFQDSPNLSPASKKMFSPSEQQGQVVIPTIVLSELLHLSRRVSLPLSFEKLLKQLEETNHFEIYPLSVAIIRESIPLTQFEIHDALIVATALHLEIPLMTADTKVVESGLIQTLRP